MQNPQIAHYTPRASLGDLRGIAYRAVPCTDPTCGGHGLPSKDLVQAAFEMQWGATGRDDLGTMISLGANAVRLYNSLGLYSTLQGSHMNFLNRSRELGLNVMPGYDTSLVVRDGECPNFDCYDTWREATLQGFKSGFQLGSEWHPAISTLVLMNEPDSFGQYSKCEPHGSWCRVKAVLSAMDGVLAAEREAGVSPGRVKMSVMWSFAERTSIDGSLTGPGIFGFQDMVAAVANPDIAKYSPRTEQSVFEEAFRTRWVHGINTGSPWMFVDRIVSEHYAPFRPLPWMIGEYGANMKTSAVIREDLEAMERRANDGGDFVGAIFFQFQTAHLNGGLAKNFGLFSLGSTVIGETGLTCDRFTPCASWPVHCLTTDLPWLPGTAADRADAVAAAWGGSVHASLGICSVVRTTTTQVTTTLAPGSLPPIRPMRGVAYRAMPCTKSFGCGRPGQDLMQVGYAEQWGAGGRNDLGVISGLGANNVRLYNSMGLDIKRDHGRFLDYSQDLALNVMPGYHLDPSNIHGQCPDFDCYDYFRKATLRGFENGFRKGNSWHPAVAALMLLDEPDGLGNLPECHPQGGWCRVKASVSALDGVLAAEREQGVEAGRVRLAVTWSFATKTSVDGKVSGPGNYGFQDMVAVMQDPQVAHYTPRASLGDLQEAFRTRWMHGLNTKSPWSFVRDVIEKDYRQFLPIPWFIGEYGASGRDEAMIQADLESMQAHSLSGHAFLGAAFLQFQTNYLKGGAAMDFGMFGLGEKVLGQTGEVCEPGHGCRKWPVHCLTTKLAWLSGSKAERAQAVAAAWGGSIDHASLCSKQRRLSAVGTKLGCQIRSDAFTQGASAAAAVLGTEAFSDQIQSRIAEVIGNNDDVLQGDVTFTSIAAWKTQGAAEVKSSPSWAVWTISCVAGVMLLLLAVCLVARRRKGNSGRSTAGEQAV